MTALLGIDRLCVRYDARDVLRALTLEVSRGEIVALMGPSGAGKTTALRAVAALQPFDEGSIVVAGFALSPGPVPPESRLVPLRRRVGLVFQGHALFEHLTARDNVTLALRHVLRKSRAESDTMATTLLTSLDVGARAAALPSQLSGGEAQRVAIARALAQRPLLLLCDEPTGHLDSDTGTRVLDLIDALHEHFGFAQVTATHDADVAARLDRAVTLADGRIVRDEAAR